MPLFGMEHVWRDSGLQAEKAVCLVVSNVTRLSLFSKLVVTVCVRCSLN